MIEDVETLQTVIKVEAIFVKTYKLATCILYRYEGVGHDVAGGVNQQFGEICVESDTSG